MKNKKIHSYSAFVKVCPFCTLLICQFQQILNNWVNFWFSIMKKLWDLAQENLVDIQGSYGIFDQYFWMSAVP